MCTYICSYVYKNINGLTGGLGPTPNKWLELNMSVDYMGYK